MSVEEDVAIIAKQLEEENKKEAEAQKCRLCELDKKTKWYFESKRFVVLECDKCHVPVVIFRKHIKVAYPQIHKKMVVHLKNVCDKIYGNGNWRLDTKQRSIKNHVHYHGRPLKNVK